MATEIDRLEIKITADATQADKSLNKLVKSLRKVHRNMGYTTSSAKKMGQSTKEFKKFDGTMRSSAKSAKSLASAIGKFYATYFLAIRGIKQLWKSIESTADYVEAFNYFTVSFGKVASKWDEDWEKYGDENARNYGNSFVTTLNDTFKKLSGVSFDPKTGLLSTTGLKNLGLNIQEVTQYAAQLGSMMDAVGQSGQTTLATTDAFVKLAGDISSLYNIDYSEAGAAIRSVLQGQSRAGYKFGWDTTMASLQATADKLDLSKAVSEMSQMEKQQLRILTILEQSRVSWGDQSNTINTLANQIRMFKNNLKEAGMILGQLFVPLLQKVLPVVNGITKAIANLLSEIAVFFGIKIEDTGQGFTQMEDDLDGVEDGFDDATESAKKFKSQLQGFDKLNVLSSSTGANGSLLETLDLTEEILKATAEYKKVWNEAFDKMQSKAEEWAKKFENTFANIKNMFKNLSEGKWFEAGQDFNSIISGIFTSLAEAINKVNWSLIGENIGKFLNGADLKELAKSALDAFLAIFKALGEMFVGMFKEAPLETTALTALLLGKGTLLGGFGGGGGLGGGGLGGGLIASVIKILLGEKILWSEYDNINKEAFDNKVDQYISSGMHPDDAAYQTLKESKPGMERLSTYRAYLDYAEQRIDEMIKDLKNGNNVTGQYYTDKFGNVVYNAVQTNNKTLGESIKKGAEDVISRLESLVDKQNKILEGILEKDTSISSRSVFEAVRGEYKSYIDRYGVNALV